MLERRTRETHELGRRTRESSSACGPRHRVVSCRRDEGPGPERREPASLRAGARHERREARAQRRSPSGRRERGKSQLLFLFLLLGLCVNACGKAPVGLTYNCVSVAVCRVGRGIFLLHCVRLLYMIAFIHVLLNLLVYCSRFTPSSFPLIETPS